MKRISGVVAGALLIASALGSPAMAQASQAAPVRASAQLEDSSELRGGFLIPAIAIVAVILGILALSGGDGDRPHSP